MWGYKRIVPNIFLFSPSFIVRYALNHKIGQALIRLDLKTTSKLYIFPNRIINKAANSQ
uniref:Uncharacterized protein n=1 Tax=Meloidogyne enterolobii TaxID=390850 RepID=A0A6V7UES2_MELEN|nr:unnamed protein product [Meloidogyne enterolobii]